MKSPLVSVVMPAYNCAKTLAQAIDSVLLQEVDLELLVINDCSKEELDSVMARYADEPRVVYIKNEQNLGAAETRNKGVALAKGAYIAFLDSDDYWAPGKLAAQLTLLDETGAALCCTAREMMLPDGTLTGHVLPVKSRITYRELLKHNCIACSSVLMPAAIARAFKMEHEDSHEDYILWLAILRQHDFACGLNEPLLKYRKSNTGKSGSKLQSAKMTYTVYRYAGFGRIRSSLLFVRYAFHGVWKHFIKK